MSESKSLLTITPLKPSGKSTDRYFVDNDLSDVAEIPSEELIIVEGKTLIESTTAWKAGKTYNNVQTTYRAKEPADGASWYCRISEHTPEEATFDAFWEKLSKNKALNEKECVSYECHPSCLLIWVNMQVHSSNQKGN